MSCNCKEKLEAQLLEQFKVQRPDLTEHKLKLEGYVISFNFETGRSKTVGQLPVLATGKATAKSGRVSEKKVKYSMVFSYCPFCGVKDGAA